MESLKRADNIIEESKEATELQELYEQYFSAPTQETADSFQQVTLFDYSMETYTSDSTSVKD